MVQDCPENKSLYLGSQMRRIKRIDRSPKLKGGYLL